MTLKLNRSQASRVKAAKARIAEKAADVEAATDTGALKAALNALWFAVNDCASINTEVENAANRERAMEQAA